MLRQRISSRNGRLSTRSLWVWAGHLRLMKRDLEVLKPGPGFTVCSVHFVCYCTTKKQDQGFGGCRKWWDGSRISLEGSRLNRRAGCLLLDGYGKAHSTSSHIECLMPPPEKPDPISKAQAQQDQHRTLPHKPHLTQRSVPKPAVLQCNRKASDDDTGPNSRVAKCRAAVSRSCCCRNGGPSYL